MNVEPCAFECDHIGPGAEREADVIGGGGLNVHICGGLDFEAAAVHAFIVAPIGLAPQWHSLCIC